MTIDDYIILANIPKIQLESDEERPGLRWRNQSPSPSRYQTLRTYRLVTHHRIRQNPLTHRVHNAHWLDKILIGRELCAQSPVRQGST